MKKNYALLLGFLTLFFFSNANAQTILSAQDDFGYMPTSAPAQIVIPNILANDLLNGAVPTLSEVTITKLFQTSPFVDIENDGSVAVAFPGPQMPGSYIIVYRITSVENPNQSATAIIRVVVGDCGVAPPVVTQVTGPSCALADGSVTFTGLPTTGWVIHVSNAMFPFDPPSGNTSSTTVTGLMGFSNYKFNVYDPLLDCISPTIEVEIPDFDCGYYIELEGTYSDYNNDGVANPGDIVNYQFSLTNNVPQGEALENINVFFNDMALSGGPLSTLAFGQTDSTTFTGMKVITQQDINLGYVFGWASSTAYLYNGGPYFQTADMTRTYLDISDGIRFVAFIDTNGNGIKDNDEQNFTHAIFNYEINGDGTIHHITSQTGTHTLLESNPNNLYHLSMTIDPLLASQYTAANVTFQNIPVTQGSGATEYYFPVTEVPYPDIAVFVYAQNLPRPGFTYTNAILYTNQGNVPMASGMVTFTKDPMLTIDAISEPGATTTPDGFTLNFTNLMPNETRFINVTMQVPLLPDVALGDVLQNSVTITAPENDINLLNNTSNLNQTVVGSYDPNDKTENHGGKILHSAFTANDYLTYTIRFENTGTASAINVRVNDVLDESLDETSVRMVTASHPYVLDRVDHTLNWRFDAIELPPSVADTNIGHGYIVFQVKPKPGYAIGDIIPNTASIYFDFNPAIVTEPCLTEFVAALKVTDFTTDQASVYPNPANNLVNVVLQNNMIDNITVTDLMGKTVQSQTGNGNAVKMDVSGLASGMYLLKVQSGGSEKTVKLIKQ